MRILKKVLKVIGALLLLAVALVAFLLWWTDPKRPVDGFFVREAGRDVFKFTDVPKGRVLSPDEVTILETWARSRTLPARVVERARIVQLAAHGVPSQDIAQQLEVSRPTVQLWRERFGIWYIVVIREYMEALAPAVARLAGH